MNEEERVIEAVPTDYEEAMQTAEFDGTPIPVMEEPISSDIEDLMAEVDRVLAEQGVLRNNEIVMTPDEAPSIDDTLQVSEELSVELTPEEQDVLEQAIASQDSEIPVNSATLQLQESTSRFSSAIWYETIQQKNIILAGLGGIGSYVAFLLARMQPNRITMYDNDRVEAVNMSGQLYSATDIGEYKANAIYRMMENYGNFYNGNVHAELFTELSYGGPIMICGFDNMMARRVFYQSWKNSISTTNDSSKHLFIDGRIKCLITCLYK